MTQELSHVHQSERFRTRLIKSESLRWMEAHKGHAMKERRICNDWPPALGRPS